MAHSIIKALYRANLVVHVAGYFHIKSNLGIPEHLAHYGGSLEYGQTSIVMLPEEDLVFTESEHKNAADLVVLTDINAIDLWNDTNFKRLMVYNFLSAFFTFGNG